MKRFLVVGHGGRESAMVKHLATDACVFAVMGHLNPSIIRYVTSSGGQYLVASVEDGARIAKYAKLHAMDCVVVSADGPLSQGVVDCVRDAGIACMGPTRSGAEIEWNKCYAMAMAQEIFPQWTPRFWTIESPQSCTQAFTEIKELGMDLVIKPVGLTGGKGVKVMGEHLADWQAAEDYSRACLQQDGQVVVTEKLQGKEFTLMALTDGEHFECSPLTYDYPYRFEGDTGPGTGGMGCVTTAGGGLPFVTEAHLSVCRTMMSSTLQYLKQQGRHFNGVLNLGVFITKQGVRFMEFNARFGDPESLNVLSLLETPFSQIAWAISQKTLAKQPIQFAAKASVVKYLVAPEYCVRPGVSHDFYVDQAALENEGFQVLFSSAIHVQGNQYQTLGNSRNVALVATGANQEVCARQINAAIEKHIKGPLTYRKDVGLTA